MHRITKVLYSGAIACSIVAGGVVSASANNIGNEGCTPGYWKNHTSNWQEYSPNQTLDSVFLNTKLGKYSKTTLSQALALKGGTGVDGATQILLRAATASVLNAAHDDLGYPLRRAGSDGIFAQVRKALASGDRARILDLAKKLDNLNNLGCPLN